MTQSEIVVWGVGTPRTLRVHWALHELGLEYDTKPVKPRTPLMDAADFLAVSPGKKIPAFQHGDLSLTESAAITRYLMDKFSVQTWSAPERAWLDQLIFFVLMEIDATALYVIRRHAGLAEIYGEAPSAVDAAFAYAHRQLAVLADLLGERPYAAGKRFSEADIHIGSILDWARALTIDLPAGLARYHDRLRTRAAYRAACEINASIL